MGVRRSRVPSNCQNPQRLTKKDLGLNELVDVGADLVVGIAALLMIGGGIRTRIDLGIGVVGFGDRPPP